MRLELGSETKSGISEGKHQMSSYPPAIPFAPDVESPPAEELEEIREALQKLEESLVRNAQHNGRRLRAVHAKAHGCATGEFQVLPNLPEELAQGLFSEERTFEAVVRFSNAADRPQPDFVPDGRGLAIKVLDVPGAHLDSDSNDASTQDFILVNHPVFFARNVRDFSRFEQVLAAPQDERLAALAKAFTDGSWNPLDWHWLEAFKAARIAGQLPKHPAGYTYFSMTPFRYGKFVAKYRVRPAGSLSKSVTELVTRLGSEPDALRHILEETLRHQQLLFEFQVQLRTSEDSMPVEDATVEWPERESAYQTVAILLIPRQEIDTEEQRFVCERLSFNVWHALVDHQPLGGINRLRREAYRRSAAWRRRDESKLGQ